jgi:hypothetical protein
MIERIPLHPGTHLTDRQALERLKAEWVCASPPTRLRIVSNIWNELECYSDCYKDLTIEDNTL